jgi:hypothetical protein
MLFANLAWSDRVGTYRNELITVDCELKDQTDRAWLVVIEDTDYWCPKSVVEYTPRSADGVVGEIEAPLWWIQSKEIPV